MGRDRKKSNSNNDVEEKVSPKKSTAKGGKNGERKDEAPAKANAKAKNVPSPLPDDEYATPSSSPSDSVEADENAEEMKPWPKEDDLELFQQIKKVLPKDDTMKYDSRLNYVDWGKVEFKNYSPDECKKRWIFVSGHLRHYRLLSEVLEDAAIWTNHPWANFNKGSKNNLRHPDLPKKPLTSYMLFYMDMKDQVGKQNPGKGMTDISKVIAEMFRNLDTKKKAKYTEKAEKEKKKYQAKMEKFMQEHPDVDVSKTKTKVELPKPPTPFSLFTAQRRDELITKEKKSKSEALEICRDEYKEMPDDTKIQWILKAKEEEPKYLADLEKFKIDHPDVPEPTKKPLLTKEEMALKDKHQGLPDKPPNSGYSLFSRKMLSSDKLKHFETKDRMMQCSLLWKELSELEKGEYNHEAEALNDKYKTDFAAYIEKLPAELRAAALAAVKTGVKRAAVKTEVSGKKLKMEATAEGGSEDPEDDSDADDFEAPKKIQKPNSSLQMFCDTNSTKYAKKNPGMSKQELSRLMAKDFARLPDEKKKFYDNMAQKSKKESEAKGSSKSPSTKKGAATKLTAGRKVANGSPSKAVASPPASPLKAKPSLNATAKPSPKTTASKSNSKPRENGDEGQLPIWAIGQKLFKGEPPKPPKELDVYYAAISSKKPIHDLTSEEMNSRWKKLARAKREKVKAEHAQILSEFNENFELFIRNLSKDDLRDYRHHNKLRESGAQNEDESSEDENENGEDGDEEQSVDSTGESDGGDEEEEEDGDVEMDQGDDNEDQSGDSSDDSSDGE